MKKNTLFILIAVITVLIIVSVLVNTNSVSTRNENQRAGLKLFPNLYDRINDIANIELSNNSGTIVIVKTSQENNDITNVWQVKSNDNYPGNVVQIRTLLIELAELEIVEAKTKKEKNYSLLGVQGLTKNTENKVLTNSQGSLITLTAGSEKIVSIIIGNKKSGHPPRSSGIKSLNYVRLDKDDQVWLVAGKLNIPDSKEFMNTEITNIPVARIQKVEIKHPKGSVVTISKKSKTDNEFSLKQLKKNKTLSNPGILNEIASVLTNLRFDDVSNKTMIGKFKNPIKVKFIMFNGLTINLNLEKSDDKFYLWLDAMNSKPFSISLKQEDVEDKNKAPDAKQEAIMINKQRSRWLYSIPAYKGELLIKRLKDLVKTKAKK